MTAVSVLHATRPAAGGARRDWPVESLRGLAVVLMVAGHVVGGTGDEGMRVPAESWWRLSYLGLEDLRMPLFTVLSGYVYAYRPVRTPGDLPRLAGGKARRLLVPLLSVGALLFLTRLVVPGTNAEVRIEDLWRVPVFGYGHLWFAQSIFLIFLVVGGLDALGHLSDRRRWSAALAGSTALFLLVQVPAQWALFSVNGAIRLLPFFLLGYGVNRFAGMMARRRVLVTALTVFCVAFSARAAMIVQDVDPADGAPSRALSFAVGVSGVMLLLGVRRHVAWRPLMWLGQFAFPIYLLHVFGTAGTRLLLDRLDVTADLPVFVVGLVAGLALPVAVCLTLGRDATFSRTVLGQAPWRPAEVGAEPGRRPSS